MLISLNRNVVDMTTATRASQRDPSTATAETAQALAARVEPMPPTPRLAAMKPKQFAGAPAQTGKRK